MRYLLFFSLFLIVVISAYSLQSFKDSTSSSSQAFQEINPNKVCFTGEAGEKIQAFAKEHANYLSQIKAIDLETSDDDTFFSLQAPSYEVSTAYRETLQPSLRATGIECAINMPTLTEFFFSEGISTDITRKLGFHEGPWSDRKIYAKTEVCLHQATSKLYGDFNDSASSTRRDIIKSAMSEASCEANLDCSRVGPLSDADVARFRGDIITLKSRFKSEFQDPAAELDPICEQAPITFGHWMKEHFPDEIVAAYSDLLDE